MAFAELCLLLCVGQLSLCLSLVRTPVIGLGHPHNPRWSSLPFDLTESPRTWPHLSLLTFCSLLVSSWSWGRVWARLLFSCHFLLIHCPLLEWSCLLLWLHLLYVAVTSLTSTQRVTKSHWLCLFNMALICPRGHLCFILIRALITSGSGCVTVLSFLIHECSFWIRSLCWARAVFLKIQVSCLWKAFPWLLGKPRLLSIIHRALHDPAPVYFSTLFLLPLLRLHLIFLPRRLFFSIFPEFRWPFLLEAFLYSFSLSWSCFSVAL